MRRKRKKRGKEGRRKMEAFLLSKFPSPPQKKRHLKNVPSQFVFNRQMIKK